MLTLIGIFSHKLIKGIQPHYPYLCAYPKSMPPRQTISFFDKLSKQVISIQVAESAQLPQDAGYFNTATNQVLLSRERFGEWETLTGHLEKQVEFILSLQKVEL